MAVVLTVVLVAGVLAALAWVQVRHVRRVRHDRGLLYERVRELFDDPHIEQDGLDYPVLTATYRGAPIELRPVLDSLAFRKLPVLWLRVTHRRALAVHAPVDVLLRPTGSEYFSPNAGFASELPADGFPAHLRIASPDAELAPPPSALHPFLSERRAKELYLSADGVRLVWLLAEGRQAHYRTTRRADLGSVRVDPAQLRFVLDTLVEAGDTFAVPAARGA